jgi:hypothetical protein
MISLLKQPLLHFLAAGLLIFAVYQISDEAELETAGDGMAIVVDRTALLNFMQYRAQAFRPDIFSEQLDAMSEVERERLVADFVREEALHREAMAMGMDQGDYIIRQRLVQKVEFLLENMVNQALVPDEEVITAWYNVHSDDYRVDAVYTFTHIFFDADERGPEQARQDAENLLGTPQLAAAGFNDASGFGDRYPFLQNYVERTRDFVVNNFTPAFVDALDAVEPSNTAWYGPFESRYGWHLVMLRQRSEPYIPELDSIRERVTDDWRYEAVLESRREAEQQVIDQYDVRVNLLEQK